MNSGRTLVNGSDLYIGNSSNLPCQIARLDQVPAGYTHPTEKQCNYTYTHPSSKLCSWTPDLSGYATKSDLNNYSIHSKPFTLLKQYDITGKTFFDERTSTIITNEFLTSVDLLPILPKKSMMLKIVVDAFSANCAMNGSLFSSNNTLCFAAASGFGTSLVSGWNGKSAISSKNQTMNIPQCQQLIDIIYIPDINAFYGTSIYTVSTVRDGVAQENYQSKLSYNRLTSLTYRFGAYTAAYSSQSTSIPSLSCAISGSPKFKVYTT